MACIPEGRGLGGGFLVLPHPCSARCERACRLLHLTTQVDQVVERQQKSRLFPLLRHHLQSSRAKVTTQSYYTSYFTKHKSRLSPLLRRHLQRERARVCARACVRACVCGGREKETKRERASERASARARDIPLQSNRAKVTTHCENHCTRNSLHTPPPSAEQLSKSYYTFSRVFILSFTLLLSPAGALQPKQPHSRLGRWHGARRGRNRPLA